MHRSALATAAIALTVVFGTTDAEAAVAGAPDTPTGVTAHAAVNAAKVYWQAPASEGDSPITGYTATASPGGQTCSTDSTGRSCMVQGLSNGATYTFTVGATNSLGSSDPSAASNAVTPAVDTANPVLVSSQVSPSRVSSLGGTVTVLLRITDNLSGVRTPTGSLDANPAIIFNRSDNTGSGVGFTRAVSRISGDEYDGVYQAVVNIPSGTSPGSWDLTVYPIDDNAGNSTFFIDRPGIMVGTPAAPANVTATVPSDRDVTISWDAPDDGGNVITDYEVKGTGGKSFTTSTASLTTSAYSDWPAASPVSFTVTAMNAAGASPESPASAPLNIPAVAPTTPNLTDAIPGDQTITGTWTSPVLSGGDRNFSYTLTATPSGHTCTTSTLTCTITGLTNEQQYTVALTAANSAGTSPGSNTLTATPVAKTVPGAPTQIAAAGGNQQASVGWLAPTDNGNAPILSYTVTASPGGQTATVPGDSTSATVIGLTNGTAYTFTVVAVNAIGDSPASAASDSVTPAGAPLRMQAPKVVVQGNKATVKWAAAVANGSPITTYKVNISKGKDKMLAAGARKIVYKRLKPGRYRVCVTARNGIGAGPYSTWTRFRIR